MRCCCANNLLPGVNYVRARLSNCRRANLWLQGEDFRRPAPVGDRGPRRPGPLVLWRLRAQTRVARPLHLGG